MILLALATSSTGRVRSKDGQCALDGQSASAPSSRPNAAFQASWFHRESGLIAQQHATRQAAQKMLSAGDRKTLRNSMADARWPYDMLRPCRGFRLNFSRDGRRDRAAPLIPSHLSPRRTMSDHTLLPE